MSKWKMMSWACGMAFALIATPSLATEDTLTIGTEGDYPPFSMADANGNVTGFDADVGYAICAKLKVTCKFVVQAFDGLIPALNSKRFDVIISGLGITEERQKQIDFSIAYAESTKYFVVPKDSPLTKIDALEPLLEALSGKSVGVQSGSTYARFVEKNVPGADIKSYPSLDQMYIDLTATRLDAAFADNAAWSDFLKKPDGEGFVRVDVKVPSSTDPSTLGRGMGVGIRAADGELKEKINVALCEIINEGQMKAMSEKWFGDDYGIACK